MGDNRLEPLVLSEAERRALENWAKRRKTAQGLALRARIVLACADGAPNIAVAARLGVSRTTVTKWRTRFLARRLDGLGDEPRPGVPRTITDAQVEEVVVRTLEEVPEGATHWSKRELARRVGMSPSSVLRIWRAFGLQPWRTEDFKISPDPLLIDKIRDVIGLYLAPPANAAVFAVDEKPQIQALEAELRHMSELVREDQLTGSLNRRGLDDIFERETARAILLNGIGTAAGFDGRPGDPECRRRGVQPHGNARSRRHHRRGHDPDRDVHQVE